jgi:hypothetical protein
MEKIDITQTAPTVKRSKAFDVFFHLVQWTWGLPVNIMGGIAYLICTKALGYKHQKFGYANIVYMPWDQGGLSMGEFIFIRENHPDKIWAYNVRIHEYGHTWQCLLLGPLYYIVVALPSVIWCHCFANYRKKNNVSYYKLYCEGWANSWGEKFSKMKRVQNEK